MPDDGTLRILVSALAVRQGGGITYLSNIVRGFPCRDGERLSVLCSQPIPPIPGQPNVEWLAAPRWTRLPLTRYLLGYVYFRFLWPRRFDFDVVYYAGGSFDASLPSPVARVVAFRNMLPFNQAARRRYGLGWMRLRHWLLRYVHSFALRRADFVIFVSEHGRNVIDHAIKGRRGGSQVIPHGVRRVAAPLDQEIASRLPDRFVLYLSTIDAYKAQLELVEAWARVRRPALSGLKLVLAGPAYGPYARRVRKAVHRNRLEDDVVFLGAVPREQVSSLAERAELNLFLSGCENCPNVLLELMCAGRPLLVSSCQPMPELGGPELAYVDPYDVDALGKAIAGLATDAPEGARVAEAASRRSRAFDWDDCGRQTWAAIRSAAIGHRAATPSALRIWGNSQPGDEPSPDMGVLVSSGDAPGRNPLMSSR
jgi:glycosyltransferase involved in cell wall biosynthesis